MTYLLVIKGDTTDSANAMRRRLSQIRILSTTERDNSVYVTVESEWGLSELLNRWFNNGIGPPGPLPVGTLLYWAPKS